MSRRRRHKATTLPDGLSAFIPVDVMKMAMGLLTATEFRVWIAVCAQSQPWRNGTAKLCRSVVAEFHLGSWTTVTTAIRKLLKHGLIVRTRAWRPRHCALYGVTYINLHQDAMSKANAREPVELATNSGSESHATAVVARGNGICSESA